MAARITAIAQQVAESLAAPGVTAARAYAPDWLDPDYWKDNPNLATEFTGRRVYVFGASQRQEGAATRAEDVNLYGIAIVVLERYDGDEPTPPNDWVDERVEWVETNIYDRLGDARETADPIVPDADPVGQEWVQVYSPELLRQLKLFRSEVVLTYRKIEDTRA